MKEITSDQFQAIKELAKYPSIIQRVTIELLNDSTSAIVIHSMPDVDWNRVEQAISDELDELFPNLEHAGKSLNYTDPMDGVECELFYINYEEETLIKLVMKKAPLQRDLEEISQDQSSTSVWSLEDIMRNEG